MAARLGKEEAARLMLHWVVGGDLVGRLYPDEVIPRRGPLRPIQKIGKSSIKRQCYQMGKL